jgi:hypothetical protein
MTSTEEKKESKAPNQIDVTTKIYPFVGKDKNRKGYYIGDYKIVIDSSNPDSTIDLPFTNFDQVDHLVYNLYNYAKTRKNPKDFFIYHPEKMSFIPGKIIKMGGGGKKHRTNRKRGGSRKNKTIKRKR